MPTTVSIKERIERQLLADFNASGHFATVERWDARGNARGHRALTIVTGDETSPQSDEEAYSITEKTLAMELQVQLAQGDPGHASADADDLKTTSGLHNELLYLMESVLMDNEFVVEAGTGVRLAIDTIVVGTSAPPIDEQQPEVYAILAAEITYQHLRNDPSAGPGITTVTE